MYGQPFAIAEKRVMKSSRAGYHHMYSTRMKKTYIGKTQVHDEEIKNVLCAQGPRAGREQRKIYVV